jgi:methylglyoxal synthase
MSTDKMNIVKRIAIVAHDSSKNDLIEWSFHNRQILKGHEIIAAGYAADVLEGTLNVTVNKLTTGSLGGYAQMGRMIIEGKVDAIIFLGYPKKTKPVDSDMNSLLHLAEEHNLVIALNKNTASVILNSAFLNERYLNDLLEAEVFPERTAV